MEPVSEEILSISSGILIWGCMDYTTQADPNKPVLVAGDPERAHIALVDSEGGIRYHVNQISASVIFSQQVAIWTYKI